MNLSPFPTTALVAGLVAGALHGGAPTPLPMPDALKRLTPTLTELRNGLGPGMELTLRTARVDASGGLHARLQQTYRGIPFWGAEAVVHQDGGPATLTRDRLVRQPLELDVTPRVAPARAEQSVLNHLAPRRPLDRDPLTELVLYPSVRAPRLKFTTVREGGKRLRRVDAAHSAFGRSRETGDWALAYHVHTEVADRLEGPRHTDYIVDARSGEILEIWDSLRRHQAPDGGPSLKSGAAAQAPGLPVFTLTQQVGHSQFSGDVLLDVLDDTSVSGAYILQDARRSFSPDYALPGSANPGTGDYGLTVYNLWGSGFTWPSGQRIKFLGTSGTWGDGQVWNEDYSDYGTVNSETAAVDALHGMEIYWDLLDNVFGQRGLGNYNAGIAARVHLQSFWSYWNPTIWGIDLGDSPAQSSPAGDAPAQSMVEPEIIAHEMTHGLVSTTAALDGRGETAAVEESYADVMASMLKFYAGGASGLGSVIPDTDGGHGDGWTFGLQVLGLNPNYPIRSLPFPQQDGISPAAWYHGLAALDPHYASGVGNRAFYFLSQGAAPFAGPQDPVASSAYVPAGFAGIGNQKAAQLWFDTLTQQLSSTADYQVLRLAMLYAANNRFGPDTPEYAAVENAFAAVNVGAAHGQAPRPLVTLHADSSLEGTGALFLVGVPTRPYTAQVANAVDPAVAWTAPEGGRVGPDGTYEAPNLAGFVLPLVATSHADALEFAVGYGLVVNGDMDDDTEFDAVDAAEMASQLAGHVYGHFGTANQHGSANLLPFDGINDTDVSAFREAFFQAFTK
ncbi:MAG TPA: M4 family metallopeptidase [Holophagaceae bacterium]|nr:M4 family metallopeptidase [Holophagaceae bacterium]